VLFERFKDFIFVYSVELRAAQDNQRAEAPFDDRHTAWIDATENTGCERENTGYERERAYIQSIIDLCAEDV
jgi:hypothetical protein